MDWQKYLAQVEADLKTAEEANTELRQEVRSLRRQLVEAGSNSSDRLQQQLARAQQQIQHDRQLYQQHVNGAQQQLEQVESGRQKTVRQLEEANAKIKTLEARVAEHQHAREGAAVPEQKFVGGVSWQQRCTVLERQLKATQRENARLLHLNDRPRSEKPGLLDDDEDDDEPEREPQARIKKEQGLEKLSAQSSLLPSDARPANYGGPPPAVIPQTPKHNKADVTSPPPVVKQRETPTPKGPVSPRARLSPRFESVDLTMSDSDDGLTPFPPTPVIRKKIPVRTSIHDNITVADQTPQKPPRPLPTPAPTPASTPKTAVPQTSTKPAFATPQNKRKRSVQNQAANGGSKLKRSKNQVDMLDEVANLSIDAHGFSDPLTGRSRRKESYQQTNDGDSDDEGENEDAFQDMQDFRFRAVCTYDDAGDFAEHYPSEDLSEGVQHLWERVNELLTVWEEQGGADWQWDFVKKRSSKQLAPPACVTQKSRKKQTNWGADGPAGKHACADCVKWNRPCFTFFKAAGGKGKGEFRLLPLAPKDRKLAVSKDKETRYWINDAKMQL